MMHQQPRAREMWELSKVDCEHSRELYRAFAAEGFDMVDSEQVEHISNLWKLHDYESPLGARSFMRQNVTLKGPVTPEHSCDRFRTLFLL
jgi:hypothetical protein